MKLPLHLSINDILLIAGLCFCFLPYMFRVWTRRGPSAEERWRGIEERTPKGQRNGLDPITQGVAEHMDKAAKAESDERDSDRDLQRWL